MSVCLSMSIYSSYVMPPPNTQRTCWSKIQPFYLLQGVILIESPYPAYMKYVQG
jgi:hypothetical protein